MAATEPVVATVPAGQWTEADAAHLVVALVDLWLYQRGQIPWCAPFIAGSCSAL